MPVFVGHQLGFETLLKTMEYSFDLGIEALSVYAFAIGNFNRSKQELEWLMDLMREKFVYIMNE
ncbi:cis-prenyltransferase, partial [Spiromyces aspiralis]